MKTPRELLSERHREMEAKLDAIRARVLAGSLQTPNTSWWSRLTRTLTMQSPFSDPASFRPWRPQVAALVAVWLAILVLKLATPAIQQSPVARSTPSSAEQLMALAEKRKLLAELMDPTAASPKPDRPAPRSERPAAMSAA